MNKGYCFKQNEIDAIINHFGKDFYEKVLKDLEIYPDKWSLTLFQFIPSYSANLVFRCHSENYGDVVLKVGHPSFGGIVTEFHTLSQYDGRRFCRVHEADLINSVLLEECIQPGIPLKRELSLHKRLSVFSTLYKGLHMAPAKAEIYPTYTKWVDRITDYMSKRQDCKELYLHMKKAKDLYLSVSQVYSQKMLLHGDFHHENILLGKNGEYVLIDPKGVIGDPVFDVPRFILNEFGKEPNLETYQKINDIIQSLEKELTIPNDILRKCLYVETIMGVCWRVEYGEEYSGLIKDVSLAEAILNT